MLRPSALTLAFLLPLAACGAPDDAATPPQITAQSADAEDDLGGPGACDLDVMSFEAELGDAAAGNRSVNVTALNLGASTCLLRGFPTVALLDAEGEPITVDVEASTGTYFLAEQAVQPVLVPPSGSAFFQIAYRSAPIAGETCTQTAQLVIATEISEPDLSATPATVPVQMAPCGEAVRLSAFREGTYQPTEIEEVIPEPGL